jgi:hypothetical protein
MNSSARKNTHDLKSKKLQKFFFGQLRLSQNAAQDGARHVESIVPRNRNVQVRL